MDLQPGYGDAIGNRTNDSASPPTGSISETTSTQSPETRSATPVPSTLARSNVRLKDLLKRRLVKMQPLSLVNQWVKDRLGLQQPMLLSPLRPLDMDPGEGILTRMPLGQMNQRVMDQ